MKIIQLFVLALRYFRLHIKQYIFLLIAISFGFAVITTLSSLRLGMERNLYNSAQSHYAGDIVVMGDRKARNYDLGDHKALEQIVLRSGIPVDNIVKRSLLGEGNIYYNGAVNKLKYVVGVDWDKEVEHFKSLKYTEKSDLPFSENSIVISSPISELMNICVGDLLLLEVITPTGQVNTKNFTVSAIVDDRSIFGFFKCYLDRRELNRMILADQDYASNMGIYLDSSIKPELAVEELYKSFVQAVDTAPLVKGRGELDQERKESWTGIRYFILPLSVYLSDVSELLLAIQLLSYFLYIMMILIIVVSVLMTYRLLLHEREKELGTMRAIVFSRGEIVILLLMEAAILFVLSILLGFALARIAVWGISFLSFAKIASFEIFMEDGSMTPVYTLRSFMTNCGIVFAVLLPAVIIPVYNATKRPLADILSGGEK